MLRRLTVIFLKYSWISMKIDLFFLCVVFGINMKTFFIKEDFYLLSLLSELKGYNWIN